MARWRRSSVLLGGMFSSKAMVSTLNRGSRTWRQRSLLEADALRREAALHWKTEMSHHQASVHAAASQVGSVFSEVHGPKPLHHSMVGPLGNLCWRNIVLLTKRRRKEKSMSSSSSAFENERQTQTPLIIFREPHLIRWTPTQAVGLIAVQSEHLDSSLDTEVMQDTSHFQRKQIVLRGKVKHQLTVKQSSQNKVQPRIRAV